MNGPMLIDEINEHTTATIGSMPTPSRVTDLMIDGYEELKNATVLLGTEKDEDLIRISGEGYVDYILLRTEAVLSTGCRFRIIIDGRYIYDVGIGEKGLTSGWTIGMVNSGLLYKFYDGLHTRTSIGNIPIHVSQDINNLSGPMALLGKWNITTFTSDSPADSVCLLPVPIRFGKSLRVGGRLWAANDVKVATLLTHYYLKTGGGN